MNKDLKFIAQCVEEWPDGEMAYVRLDYDGEICFSSEDMKGSIEHDFFPGNGGDHFVKACDLGATGYEYTRQEYENARKSLYNQNKNS